MSYSRLTTDLNVIQKLDDEPNDVGGLSAAELKAKFDEGTNAVKEYINNTLLAELEGADGAKSLGASVPGLTGIDNVNDALAKLLELLQEITQGAVADGSITAVKLATAAVETAKIAAAAVTEAKLANNSVSTAKVVDLAITAAKLAADAVETVKIKDGAVTTPKLADDAVTNAKVADAAIGTAEIDSYAVTEQKLAGGSVSARTVQAGAVSTDFQVTIPATIDDNGTPVSAWAYDGPPYMQEIEVSGLVPVDPDDASTAITWTCNSADADVLAAYTLLSLAADTDSVLVSASSEVSVDIPVIATQNSVPYTFTIPADDYIPTGAPYKQDVSVVGLLATDKPIVDIVPSAVMSTAEAQLEAYGVIFKMVAGADTLTVYASDKTQTDVTVHIKAVRK